MKIIATAALAAATLVLTATVPALADGDPRSPQTSQQGLPSSTAGATSTLPTDEEEEAEIDFSEGLLPRLVGKVL